MRCHILSDLHREFAQMPPDWRAPPADVTILAGDIGKGSDGLLWALRTIPDRPLVYVAGNHEFYGGDYFEVRHHLHATATAANMAGQHVVLLDNDTAILGGVRFVGATLWTDYALYGHAEREAHYAEWALNDFRRITFVRRPLRAADLLHEHNVSRMFLEAVMGKPHDGPTVVVSHHAPSERSAAEFYQGDTLNAAFASRLEPMIEKFSPALWVHGHMHSSADYRLGDTRVVCNPRGYPNRGGGFENPAFDPDLVLDLPVAALTPALT